MDLAWTIDPCEPVNSVDYFIRIVWRLQRLEIGFETIERSFRAFLEILC
jgi:hypothetical protein